MNAPDEVIHQSTRLRIMSALHALPPRQLLGFGPLRRIVGATDGNLGSHLNTLETAGYVKIVKDFVGRKPRTRIAITAQGRRAFKDHVRYLRAILDCGLEDA